MSRNKLQAGFSLIEVVIVLTLASVISTIMYTFFRTNFVSYLNLQGEASNFTDLARQSQRIGNVVRGLTDIVSAANNDLVIYAYFYPTDSYVSLVHYYVSPDGKTLYADVTQMTANPPVGTPVAGSLKTYTIMNNFQQTAGVNLFEYLDSAGSKMSLPIADLHTVKGIRVNLAVASSNPNANQAVTTEVSLRNRKTNL